MSNLMFWKRKLLILILPFVIHQQLKFFAGNIKIFYFMKYLYTCRSFILMHFIYHDNLCFISNEIFVIFKKNSPHYFNNSFADLFFLFFFMSVSTFKCSLVFLLKRWPTADLYGFGKHSWLGIEIKDIERFPTLHLSHLDLCSFLHKENLEEASCSRLAPFLND